jgi:ABC-type Fe3+-hydroxamate transport system substrate-binding protein
MGNDYMTSGDNLRMIGHAFAAKRAVDQTAANYQAHIDKLQKKLAAMEKAALSAYDQRDAWMATCREYTIDRGIGRDEVLAVYDRKKAEIMSQNKNE